MGGKVFAIVISMIMVIANAIKVNITEEWIPEFGWEVTCFWDIPLDDSLQSVRLSNNGMQFMIYRPEELFDITPPSPVLHRTTRCTADIHLYVVNVPPIQMTRFASSFIIRTANDWNNLPVSMFPATYDVGVFKRRKHGPVKADVFGNMEMMMTVNCEVSEPGNRKGRCVLKVEPLQPPVHNFAVKCEVSGERPTFKIVEEEHIVKILIPPSNATMVSKIQQEDSQAHVSLNCSSFGLPAPNILWTIGDDKRAQADFTGRAWNATSKLWHVWSFLSYTPAGPPSIVTCTPIATVDGESVKGVPAEFNSARRYPSATYLLSAAILVLQFSS